MLKIKIDLIMDSNSYLMASNNINITNYKEELNKIEFELDFKILKKINYLDIKKFFR